MGPGDVPSSLRTEDVTTTRSSRERIETGCKEQIDSADQGYNRIEGARESVLPVEGDHRPRLDLLRLPCRVQRGWGLPVSVL